MNAVTETKPDHKSIFAALAAAQMEMGKAVKDTKNDHFRSKYADLASVMDACLVALNRNGICVMQPTGEDERGRYVETILAHVTGETVSCRVPLIVQKNDMQGYGSAVTYARRYGLMSMAGIAPEDDDGNAAAKAAPKTEKPAPTDADIAHDRAIIDAMARIESATGLDDLGAVWKSIPRGIQSEPRVIEAKDKRKAALNPPVEADEIPY